MLDLKVMQLLNGNYIDLLIILVLIYFATEAWRHGFWVLLADFVSFLGSLIISLRFYKLISEFLKVNFSINYSISNALGFLFSAIILESILGFTLGYLVHILPEKFKKHKLNKLLGIIPALGEGLVLTAFFLSLVISFPIKPQIKSDIIESKIGGIILERTTTIERYINEVFGGVINDTLTYLTVKPESRDSVDLGDIETVDLKVDEISETILFNKVNEERRKIALPELMWSPETTIVARKHARDMWERKYFSHYSPEGKDVGERLIEAKIKYTFAGENLALAPTVATAHIGLMNSEGHRKNILEPHFKKIGVGVIDNGVYGKMFVEVFTD